ncbi:MAG: hypothetical protein OXG05_09970 [Gammaproteobacteria bacterium]|nr:hypothetical protein [Gammaproteobacteria bacterium]
MTEPRKKGRQGRRYSDEFECEAVQLLTSTPASAAHNPATTALFDALPIDFGYAIKFSRSMDCPSEAICC